MAAPPMPWKARAMVRKVMVGAEPQAIEPRVNRPRPIMNSLRRP